jgi:hypothetical protein
VEYEKCAGVGNGGRGKAVVLKERRAITERKERVDVPVEAAAIGAGDGQVLSVVVFHCCSRVCVCVSVCEVVGDEVYVLKVSCGERVARLLFECRESERGRRKKEEEEEEEEEEERRSIK